MLVKTVILFAILSLVSVFSATHFFMSIYGKYAARVNIGTVEISVVSKEKKSHLLGGKELNRYFKNERVTQVVFDTYDRYPGMKRMRGFDIGEYDDDAAEEDKIKIYYYRNAAYILSENVINAISLEGMFKNCYALKSVEFYNFDTSEVKSMKEMFYNCSSLKKTVIKFDATKTEDMSGMFWQCKSLTSLDLSEFDTSSVKNMNEMFFGCRSLESIYASEKWNTKNVVNGKNMFKGCVKLVGGNGTKYGSEVSFVYARIDKTEAPGYFTEKILS